MRELTTKTLLIAWIIGFLFTTMFMLSILVNYWFSFAAILLLICHVILVKNDNEYTLKLKKVSPIKFSSP